ncbi:Hypothetical_protein [Hexamita inflata]|uniref:Hypothetical_protein n=1 Tax=Hexamita inflata TaxID=28002 RepID=A0ABP1HIE6_9EUKA
MVSAHTCSRARQKGQCDNRVLYSIAEVGASPNPFKFVIVTPYTTALEISGPSFTGDRLTCRLYTEMCTPRLQSILNRSLSLGNTIVGTLNVQIFMNLSNRRQCAPSDLYHQWIQVSIHIFMMAEHFFNDVHKELLDEQSIGCKDICLALSKIERKALQLQILITKNSSNRSQSGNIAHTAKHHDCHFRICNQTYFNL